MRWAGVHFLFVGGRYRVSFNHLEYPGVVVALRGPRRVRDVSFTTREPERWVALLQGATASHAAGMTH